MNRTSLWLILVAARKWLTPPRVEKPGPSRVALACTIAGGINPNRQRKGKSGEIDKRR